MKYTIGNLRLLVIDCLDGHKESCELGEFAYEAWYYYSEDSSKKTDRKLLDFLLEISSEWGYLQESEDTEKKFTKGYLENLLARIENFMNVEGQDNNSLI